MDTYAVQRTVGRYCQFLDEGNFGGVAELFTDDGVLCIPSLGIRRAGREEVRAQIQEMNGQSTKGLHATFNPTIEVAGAKAAGIFDFLWVSFAGRPQIGLGGRYRLSFALSRGQWLIQEMNIEIRSDPAFLSA